MLAFLLTVMIAGTPTPHILTVPPELMVIPPDPVEVQKDRWIDALVQCESNGRPSIKILDTDNYYVYGLAQFKMQTWLAHGKKFGATKENIYDGELQKTVVRDMLDNGGFNHWVVCSKRATAKVGPYSG